AFCTGAISYAQVGIGTATPNPSSQLEITSDKRGILIPRVELKSLTDNGTITNGNVESLLVYNVTDSGDLQPGYYFWKGNNWNRFLTELDGKEWSNAKNKSFVVEDDLLKLYDENDDVIFIDLQSLNIVTTLVKDSSGNGKYTYKNEAGTEVMIDVQADVINNFEDIINNTNVQEILNQYLTENAGNVHYDGNSFTYVNEDGDTVTLDMSTIIKVNETITTLVKDPSGNGQYTYTNEAGVAVVIDVQADVINNFEDIINQTDVQEIINNIIKNVGGNVHYDGNSFTYVNEDGDTVTLDISTIIKANETITTLVKDPSGNGQYTYTNEAGVAVVIDVQADVINN
ncbi:collagen triple helix repeat-containing protein, partial [Myroides odoratus DSM 2801]